MLALVAFFDTQIGVGFLVFGEVAFLAAGVAFGITENVTFLLVVFVAAWLGDMSSFALGRHYGARPFLRFLKPAKRRRTWRWAQGLLRNHGMKFVVVSRFLGPAAWVTPFLAGTLQMPMQRFAPAAGIGVALGIGQFVLLGYLGVRGISQLQGMLAVVSAHAGSIILFTLIGVTMMVIWHFSTRKATTRLILGFVASLGIFTGTNLVYFFAIDAHAQSINQLANQPLEVCALPKENLLAFPGGTDLHLPQPLNVVLISSRKLDEVMVELGWQQNQTFSKDNISLQTYVRLLMNKTPPVSELYFNERPADFAFQMPGTITERLHIRWWQVGVSGDQNIFLGAISRDEEIAIKYYRTISALLHDIVPEVDQERDTFAAQISAAENLIVVSVKLRPYYYLQA